MPLLEATLHACLVAFSASSCMFRALSLCLLTCPKLAASSRHALYDSPSMYIIVYLIER